MGLGRRSRSDVMKSLEIQRELTFISQSALDLGVEIDFEYDGCIHVPSIARDRSNPTTKGNGKKVLNVVITLADRHKLEIQLEYVTFETKLGDYYQGLGFAPYGQPDPITNMRRPPLLSI